MFLGYPKSLNSWIQMSKSISITLSMCAAKSLLLEERGHFVQGRRSYKCWQTPVKGMGVFMYTGNRVDILATGEWG